MDRSYKKILDSAESLINVEDSKKHFAEYSFKKHCDEFAQNAVGSEMSKLSVDNKIDAIYRIMSKTFITNEFLQNCERWAKWKGHRFYVGDADQYMENLGFLTDKYGKEWHVTRMQDVVVCYDECDFIILCEKSNEIDNYFPPSIKIFSIKGLGKKSEVFDENVAGNEQYTRRPTFERFKKDFKDGSYTFYNSLIDDRRSFKEYSISPFHENSNPLSDYAVFARNLEYFSRYSGKKVKDIEVHSYESRHF